MQNQRVLILNFGGQYDQLIARRVRELGVYCEVMPHTMSLDDILKFSPIGIIFTGGPDSVYAQNSCHPAQGIFSLNIPILGICYGCQLIAYHLGGEVAAAREAALSEYGKTDTRFDTSCALFRDLPDAGITWMSHGDTITRAPDGFRLFAHSRKCANAAIGDPNRRIYGVQFHPEVSHTQNGGAILRNFLFGVCGALGDWTMSDYVRRAIDDIRQTTRGGRVLLALSGGVDSSVCAALMARAIGKQLACVFVDHGFLRKYEADEVESAFAKWDIEFIRVNAQQRFLSKLAGVTEPEDKRKRIGEEFIRVFETEAKKLGRIDYLAQGTIYPDVIESGAGNAATIKSHHNVGGLPERLEFKQIIEPLRMLFKDEVRALGAKLGLPDALINRQPFPGPGLAIRVIGEATDEKLSILREADAIFREEIARAHLDNEMAQYFAALTNMRSVGVMGDGRTYDCAIALRAVTTADFMTADWARIPYEVLDRVSGRIVNEVKRVNRVLYDITSKPPATVEFE